MEMTRPIVEEAVRERMDRMQSDCVDLLQVRPDLPRPTPSRSFRQWEASRDIHSSDARIDKFHWNDYSERGYITALQRLQDLQREGLISALGLCNFDTIRVDEICTILGPRSIVSNQIQVRQTGPVLPRRDQLAAVTRCASDYSSPLLLWCEPFGS